MGNPSAPVGRSVDGIWGPIIIFLTHSLTKVNFGEIFGKGEDSPQVIYCGVQKGMIDSSRLCNKGLTNRETVLVDTFWACL